MSEAMKDFHVYCPHKEKVIVYCSLCKIYLCHDCQINDHIGHIDSIKGLDSLFSEAIVEYEAMTSELGKTLLKTEYELKDDEIDETLALIENRISNEYNKLINDIRTKEEDNIKCIKESSVVNADIWPHQYYVSRPKQATHFNVSLR